MPAAPSFAVASGLFLHIVEPRDHPRLGRRVARIALLGFFRLGLAHLAVRFLLTLGHVGFLGDGGRRCPPARSLGALPARVACFRRRSEEHTSELQSLMRISYAV